MADIILSLTAALGFAALVLAPGDASAASFFAEVEQGGTVISDPGGLAEIMLGETATISIFLSLDAGEDASIFEGVFDLAELGLGATSDPLAVGSSWTSVSENTASSQSTWSDVSSPIGGDRLVAQWLIDSTLSAIGDSFGVSLASGTFAGTDLSSAPFFELIPISTLDGTLLTEVVVGGESVVPEPTAILLFGSGLLVAAASLRPKR